MRALIYEITQACSIVAALTSDCKIQIPKSKMSEVIWLKDRLVSQLLDPASISSPPQAPSQSWPQRTPSHLAEAF